MQIRQFSYEKCEFSMVFSLSMSMKTTWIVLPGSSKAEKPVWPQLLFVGATPWAEWIDRLNSFLSDKKDSKKVSKPALNHLLSIIKSTAGGSGTGENFSDHPRLRRGAGTWPNKKESKRQDFEFLTQKVFDFELWSFNFLF